MQLNILSLDFESYYSDTYSLKKMTPVEYLLSREFEVIGAAARLDTATLPIPAPLENRPFIEKARWIDGPDLPKLFARIDWSKTALLAHNVAFDGALLAWRYGIIPALYIDTLGMVRATMPQAKGASLDKSLAYINAPPKGDALAQAKGLRLADLRARPDYFAKYRKYAERDSDGSFWLFEHLAHGFAGTDGVGQIHKNEEFLMMDAVARMTILPQFSLDVDVLKKYLAKVKADKQTLMDKLSSSGILDTTNPRGDLMSNERYAQVLRNLGIDPPMKVSMKTNKETYAFSKTDQDFTALLEDSDPLVQAVVAARLGIKSTMEETRTQRFIDIAGVQWPPESDITAPALVGSVRAPFPLKFSGAHTHRLSGDWSLNLQNLGRKSQLRAALVAPKGHVIVSADASQIEARVVSWLAGCRTLVNAFDAGEDVYATLASSVYNFTVNKKDHPGERFVGKTGILGLGFGMAAPKFIVTCWNQGRAQGLPAEVCRVSAELADRTVTTYRTKYHEIPNLWLSNTFAINTLATRGVGMIGVLKIDGPSQSIILPNGMRLYYHNMRKVLLPVPGQPDQPHRATWVFDYGRETKYTFGGKMTENEVQALARIITMNAATRIRKMTGVKRVLGGQIHDQLIYVVPERDADALLKIVLEEMSRRLDWFKDIPLAAEGGIGYNLLEIK